MGNRANIGFKQDGQTVYLYQHWAPEHLLKQYARALKVAQPRWDDPSYATRIMISQIIGEDWGQQHGYGIGPNIVDNEHSVVVVDFDDNLVRLYDKTSGVEQVTWKFDTFIRKYA